MTPERERELREAHANLPPVPKGMERFYHGGQSSRGDVAKALFGSSRDYTHDFEYAIGYARRHGSRGNVWYINVHKSAKNVQDVENFFGADALLMDKSESERFRLLHDPEWRKANGLPAQSSYGHLSPTDEQYGTAQPLLGNHSGIARGTEPSGELPPRLADLESESLESTREETTETKNQQDAEQTIAASIKPEGEQYARIPGKREPLHNPGAATSARSESLEVPDQSKYDARDKEFGETIKQRKKEKIAREKRHADIGKKFARAVGSFTGRKIGSTLKETLGIGIPHEFKSPLMDMADEMFFGGSNRGVGMFGEGQDAQVDGGDDESPIREISSKLDRVIELLGDIANTSDTSGAQPADKPDKRFAASENLSSQASGASKAARAAAETVMGSTDRGSSSDDMWEMAAKAMIRALIAAA